jgi:hypothetical protein
MEGDRRRVQLGQGYQRESRRGRPESSWKLKRRFIPGSHRIGVLNPWKGEPP